MYESIYFTYQREPFNGGVSYICDDAPITITGHYSSNELESACNRWCITVEGTITNWFTSPKDAQDLINTIAAACV